MSTKEGPVAEADGLTERADRSGRLRIAPDLLPEVIAWLLLHHQRAADAQRAATDRDPGMTLPYTVGVVGDTQRRMEVIVQVIDSATDSFSQKEYGEALTRVGMMIAARSDAGEPLTKIGRLYDKEGVAGNGPHAG